MPPKLFHFSTAMLRVGLLSGLVLFLSACSPVYEISYDYTPPSSKQGLQCLTQCNAIRKQCDNKCQAEYQRCAVDAEAEAKRLMPGLVAAYENAYDSWLFERRLYRWNVDRYHFNRLHFTDRCMKNGNTRSACYSTFQGRFGYEPYFNDFEPRRPSYSRTLAQIKEKRCSKECGCEKSYRLCYTSCGGTVNTRKTCVKNCQSP